MGLFDIHCAVSGIALQGPTVLIPLVYQFSEWRPCGLPIEDTPGRTRARTGRQRSRADQRGYVNTSSTAANPSRLKA